MTGQKGRSGGKRPGAGRPAAFKARMGDWLIIERSSIAKVDFHKPEAGRVVGIGNEEIELQIGNDILVIRFPDPGELSVA